MREVRLSAVVRRDRRQKARKLERAKSEHLRATAARCRGATLVLDGMGDGLLSQSVQDRGLEVTSVDLSRGSSFELGVARSTLPGAANGAARFGTAVVAGVVEHLSDAAAASFLYDVWESLRPGGRLIVTVPNADAARGKAEVGGYGRRSLKRLLRRLEEPRLATDQPFRWLTMYVEKPGRRPRLNRTRQARYRVTAKLCRGRTIDLGCGEGHLTRMISERGLDVLGVDISKEKIERAHQFYPELEFVLCDIARLELAEASFDTAVIAEVLEHVPEAQGQEMLDKAWRLLREGGRLIVSVPNQDCIPHPHHVREFDRRELKAMLRAYGRPRLVTDQPFKWLMMYVEKRP